MKYLISTVTTLGIILALLNGCGSSTSSSSASPDTNPSSTNPLAVSASTIRVANPAATTSSSNALNFKKYGVLYSSLQFAGLSFIAKFFGLNTVETSHAETTTAPTNDAAKDPDVVVTKAVADLDGSKTAAQITADLASFTTGKVDYRASCYGPGWTDDARTPGGATVNRPTGDLGIASATADGTTDTTACSVAELKALMGGYPDLMNKILTFQAALITAEYKAGKSLPAIGGELDGKTDLGTITGVTVTSAKLQRLDNDTDGNAVYKTTILGTETSSGKDIKIYIWHTPQNADNTKNKGLVQALLPHTATMGGAGDQKGLSMVYSVDAGTYTFLLKAAANRATASEDFFNATTGQVDFTKTTAFGEDGHVMLAKYNPTTNLGTVHYAWQAGQADGATRTFSINVPAGTEGALTGVAYFGFGSDIASLTTTSAGGSSIWGTKMYCDWLQGLSGGTAQSGKLQKQVLTQNTSGVFEASTNKIYFAPAPNCNATATWTVTAATPSSLNGARTTLTNDLATYTANDVVSVTAPTFSKP